jgi:hypothetical protein
MNTALVAIGCALLGVGGTALTAWLGFKGKKPDQQTADWSQFSQEMREWTEDRLRERDDRIAALESEMTSVKTSLGVVTIKYRAALFHGRYLYRKLAALMDPSTISEPPTEITEDWYP